MKRLKGLEEGSSTTDPKSKWACSTTLIPSKLSFFARSGMLGTFVYFINIFLRDVGLTVEETGLISGITSMVSTLTAPFWGFLIDYSGRRKLIFTILAIGMSIAVVASPFAAREVNPIDYNIPVNTTSTNSTVKNTAAPFTSKIFFVTLTLLISERFFTGPLGGMVDAAVMNVISTREPTASFGLQRVYGGLSFGLMAYLSGIAIDHFTPFFNAHMLSKYTAAFLLYVPIAVFSLIVNLILLNQMNLEPTDVEEETKKEEEEEKETSQMKLIFTTCKKPLNFIFFLTCFVVGLSNMTLVGYLYMLMKDQMKASKSLMGLSSLIQSIAQVFIYPFADKIIKIVGGPMNGIALSLFAYFIRFLVNSYFTSALYAVISQSLHAFCFSLFWVAAVKHTQQIAPNAIYITMFTLVNSAYFGAGGVVANLVGGQVYGKLGGAILFRGMSLLALGWMFLCLAVFNIDWIKNVSCGRQKVLPHCSA